MGKACVNSVVHERLQARAAQDAVAALLELDVGEDDDDVKCDEVKGQEASASSAASPPAAASASERKRAKRAKAKANARVRAQAQRALEEERLARPPPNTSWDHVASLFTSTRFRLYSALPTRKSRGELYEDSGGVHHPQIQWAFIAMIWCFHTLPGMFSVSVDDVERRRCILLIRRDNEGGDVDVRHFAVGATVIGGTWNAAKVHTVSRTCSLTTRASSRSSSARRTI